MESTCHKWVVLRSICKNNESCTIGATFVSRKLCRFLYKQAHITHSVHIYTGFSGTYVYAGTNLCRCMKRIRNRFYQSFFTLSVSFMNQSRKSAQKVYANSICGTFQCFGNFDATINICVCNQTDRSNRNSFIYNRNTIFAFDFAGSFYKISRTCCNLIINFIAFYVNIIRSTIKQTYAHCNRADVQMLFLYHSDGLCNFICRYKHFYTALLNLMHRIKNIYVLELHLKPHFFT